MSELRYEPIPNDCTDHECLWPDGPPAPLKYADYCLTPHFRQTKNGALERAGRRCVLCARPHNLIMHHNSYLNLWREDPHDVTILCYDCHEWFHKTAPFRLAAPRQIRRAA